MKTKQTLILFLATLTLSVAAADSANRLRFPVTGFSIAPLETSPGDSTCQALMMFLPATGSFAANVNVQIQPFSGTIEEYTKLTLKQFEDLGIKVIEQKKAGKSAVIFEYSGKLQGRSLHLYARAEKAGGHFYLTTATATEEEWPKQGVQLKACVDSFRCETASR
jgi:hypothetical protein